MRCAVAVPSFDSPRVVKIDPCDPDAVCGARSRRIPPREIAGADAAEHTLDERAELIERREDRHLAGIEMLRSATQELPTRLAVDELHDEGAVGGQAKRRRLFRSLHAGTVREPGC